MSSPQNENNNSSLSPSSPSTRSSSTNVDDDQEEDSSLQTVPNRPPPGKQPKPNYLNQPGTETRETPNRIEDLREEDLNYSDLKTEQTSSVCFVGRRIIREYKTEFILPNDMKIAVSRKETLIPGAGSIEVFVDLAHAVPDYFDELVFESQCIENYIEDDEWATGMLMSDSTKDGDLLRQLEEGCKEEPELYTIERIERRKNREQVVSIKNDPVIRNIHLFKEDLERDLESRPTSITTIDYDDLTPTAEEFKEIIASYDNDSVNNDKLKNGRLQQDQTSNEKALTPVNGNPGNQFGETMQQLESPSTSKLINLPPELPLSVMTNTFEKAFSNCANITTTKIESLSDPQGENRYAITSKSPPDNAGQQK